MYEIYNGHQRLDLTYCSSDPCNIAHNPPSADSKTSFGIPCKDDKLSLTLQDIQKQDWEHCRYPRPTSNEVGRAKHGSLFLFLHRCASLERTIDKAWQICYALVNRFLPCQRSVLKPAGENVLFVDRYRKQVENPARNATPFEGLPQGWKTRVIIYLVINASESRLVLRVL